MAMLAFGAAASPPSVPHLLIFGANTQPVPHRAANPEEASAEVARTTLGEGSASTSSRVLAQRTWRNAKGFSRRESKSEVT